MSLRVPANSPMFLIKEVLGTWSIAGTTNSLTGTTSINGGVLRFDSANPNVTEPVAVDSDGSLGGNGSANALKVVTIP